MLASAQVARTVVERLGLQILPENPNLVRSDLFVDPWIGPQAPEGVLTLVYDEDGTAAQILDGTGNLVAEGPVGAEMDGGWLRLKLQPPPEEARQYGLVVHPVTAVQGEVQGRVGAAALERTNIVRVSYRSPDPILAPKILNAATAALQGFGEARIRRQAERDLEFIRQRFDSAVSQLEGSSRAIRRFKESASFTSLSIEERQLVNRYERTEDRMQELVAQLDALHELTVSLQTSSVDGIDGVDLVAFIAVLPAGVNPQIRGLADEVQDRKDEVQTLLIEERKTEDHPQVKGARAQLQAKEVELRTAVEQNLGVLDAQIADQQAQLDQVRAEEATFPELQNRLDDLNIQLGFDQETVRLLKSQQYQAEITVAGTSAYVASVDSADSVRPVTLGGRTNLSLGALLGLLLGVGAAFFLEYLDRTVRTSADIETVLGIPVLGVIPRLREIVPVSEEDDRRSGGDRRGDRSGDDDRRGALPLMVALDPLDAASEAYGSLSMNLEFMSTDDEPIRTLLFSSPGPGEGKSTTSINYALMLAQQGQPVLLIDADLRRPSLHRAMDVIREPGLTNLLVGDAELREAVRPNVLPNLDLLPSGPSPPNPRQLLNTKTMQRLLEQFEEKYSHVVLDAPPILGVNDAAILGAHADGVVLVLRSGNTHQRAAERAVDQFRRTGARLVGAVLKEISTDTAEESYYMQYYYSYHPRETGGLKKLAKGLQTARIW